MSVNILELDISRSLSSQCFKSRKPIENELICGITCKKRVMLPVNILWEMFKHNFQKLVIDSRQLIYIDIIKGDIWISYDCTAFMIIDFLSVHAYLITISQQKIWAWENLVMTSTQSRKYFRT